MRRNKRPSKSHKALSERRRWPRLPLAIPVFVRGSDARGKDMLEFATILNISAGGVLLTSRKPIQSGSRVLLEIPIHFSQTLEAVSTQHKLQARIVRTAIMDECYLSAGQFKSPLRMHRSEPSRTRMSNPDSAIALAVRDLACSLQPCRRGVRAIIGIIRPPALHEWRGSAGSTEQIPDRLHLCRLSAARAAVRNNSIRKKPGNPVRFAGKAVEPNALKLWIRGQQFSEGQGVLIPPSAALNGDIIRVAMEPKFWVLKCKVCHRWHKGDLVRERELTLDLAPVRREIACPDRPSKWASYSVNDWKQMTEAEWIALPEAV